MNFVEWRRLFTCFCQTPKLLFIFCTSQAPLASDFRVTQTRYCDDDRFSDCVEAYRKPASLNAIWTSCEWERMQAASISRSMGYSSSMFSICLQQWAETPICELVIWLLRLKKFKYTNPHSACREAVDFLAPLDTCARGSSPLRHCWPFPGVKSFGFQMSLTGWNNISGSEIFVWNSFALERTPSTFLDHTLFSHNANQRWQELQSLTRSLIRSNVLATWTLVSLIALNVTTAVYNSHWKWAHSHRKAKNFRRTRWTVSKIEAAFGCQRPSKERCPLALFFRSEQVPSKCFRPTTGPLCCSLTFAYMAIAFHRLLLSIELFSVSETIW